MEPLYLQSGLSLSFRDCSVVLGLNQCGGGRLGFGLQTTISMTTRRVCQMLRCIAAPTTGAGAVQAPIGPREVDSCSALQRSLPLHSPTALISSPTIRQPPYAQSSSQSAPHSLVRDFGLEQRREQLDITTNWSLSLRLLLCKTANKLQRGFPQPQT